MSSRVLRALLIGLVLSLLSLTAQNGSAISTTVRRYVGGSVFLRGPEIGNSEPVFVLPPCALSEQTTEVSSSLGVCFSIPVGSSLVTVTVTDTVASRVAWVSLQLPAENLSPSNLVCDPQVFPIMPGKRVLVVIQVIKAVCPDDTEAGRPTLGTIGATFDK